jgi:DNA invertase Pin-like site-specific DNA recombinase
MADLVAYYRVSTKHQGESGLGLEGQQTAVATYARQTGASIKAGYTEVESGKKADRPQLMRAMAHARRSRATLIVAKLDRLSRNVAFLSALMESKVPFVCCDNPHANPLTIHILAAVAEDETKKISQRTAAALQAAKARGKLLGSARPGHWDGREHLRLAGIAKARASAVRSIRKNATAAYADLLPDMVKQREAGLSLAAIAAALNHDGHTTRRGKLWNMVQVARVLARR